MKCQSCSEEAVVPPVSCPASEAGFAIFQSRIFVQLQLRNLTKIRDAYKTEFVAGIVNSRLVSD